MMERALKERIIGAAVLVSFVVLVVPIFLDGPPDARETVSQPVLLPGQEEQKTQTVVLDRNRTEPVPVPSSPGPTRDSTATPPAPKVEKQVAEVATGHRHDTDTRRKQTATLRARDKEAAGYGLGDRHVGRAAWQFFGQGECREIGGKPSQARLRRFPEPAGDRVRAAAPCAYRTTEGPFGRRSDGREASEGRSQGPGRAAPVINSHPSLSRRKLNLSR